MFCWLDEDIVFPRMPECFKKDLKQWKTKKSIKNEQWFVVPLVGTTFSGHPTRTTLGNTLRSLAYVYYYLEVSGVNNPWDNKDCHVIAAGDDVVVWICDAKVDKLYDSIKRLTVDHKEESRVGLGQVIKTVEVKEWYDVEF